MIVDNRPVCSNVNFRAKFFYTDDLYQLAKYAAEKGKFDKLNQARKNIDSAYLTRRLKLDFKTTENGHPVVSFTRLMPDRKAMVPYSPSDYKFDKITIFVGDKKMNVLKFAFEKFIKLGNNAPNNKMYKEVVVSK